MTTNPAAKIPIRSKLDNASKASTSSSTTQNPNLPFDEFRVSSLAQYIVKIIELSKNNEPMWFRGHSDCSYKLQPSLFRNRSSQDENELREIEQRLNRRFRDRSMPYTSSKGSEGSEMDGLKNWLRLFTMQHYGTPTRLLDWSENAITALCFSMLTTHPHENQDKDAAVWALKPSLWNKMGNDNHREILNIDDHGAEPYAPLPSEKQHLRPNWPIAIFGMHNSPRIAIQQGTFIVFPPGKPTAMEDLASSSEYESRSRELIFKITIDKQAKPNIIQELRILGFRHSMLYPDLQGLATDLKNEAT